MQDQRDLLQCEEHLSCKTDVQVQVIPLHFHQVEIQYNNHEADTFQQMI